MNLVWTILGTRWAQYLLIGLAVAGAIGVVVLMIYRRGQEAAIATMATATLERTAAAARARAKVKPNDQGAMDADPFNRDRR